MVDATPLTNADFRKLLATPRREAATPSGAPKDGRTPQRNSNKPKKPFPRPKPGAAAEESEDSKYRDRAEERRRGVNPDYANTNQLLSVLGPSGDVDPSKLSVAESKYLGGDLEHTHLVKGLDYALLNKMRSTMHKEDGSQAAGDDEGPAAGDKPAAGQVNEGVKREELVMNHPIAKGIYAALFDKPNRTYIAESFLPRRTAFVYSFEPDEDGVISDIPTTLRRSKADCPKPTEAVFAKVDTAVIGRIAKIMSYIKTGAGGKKIKKKERDEILGELMGTAGKTAGGGVVGTTAAGAAAGAAAQQGAMAPPKAPPPRPKSLDDDIFEDAGTDYVPSVTGKKQAAAPAAPLPGPPGGGVGDDMEIEEGEMVALPPPPPPDQHYYPPGHDPASMYDNQYGQQWPNEVAGEGYAGPHAVQEAHQHQVAAGGTAGDEPKWRVRTRKAAEREVDYVDDAYGEYYPMAGGFDVPVLDDEDDADVEGAAKKAAPGAAKPEEKSKTSLAKEAGREDAAKLNSQLQKIERLFKDKGFDHADAFGRTPSRKTQTGEDPNLVLKAKKRQRI